MTPQHLPWQVGWRRRERSIAFPQGRARYANGIAGLFLMGMCLVACQPAKPTHSDLTAAFDQAFSSYGKPEQLVLLGALRPPQGQAEQAGIVWLVQCSEKPTVQGTVTTHAKIPLTSLHGLMDAVQYGKQTLPQIKGKQCEFLEWKNGQGVWRMRLAESKEGFILTLEQIERSEKGGTS